MQQALTLMMVFNGDDGDCDDDGNCGDDDDDDNNNDADGNNYCQHNKQNQAQETKMTLNTDNGDSGDDDDDGDAVHCSKPTWVVGGLFDELQVKLVAQEVTFQTLEHHVLHHRHVILVCVR